MITCRKAKPVEAYNAFELELRDFKEFRAQDQPVLLWLLMNISLTI